MIMLDPGPERTRRGAPPRRTAQMHQTRAVSYLGAPIDVTGLPAGFRCRTPDERDVPDVVALLSANRSPGDKPVDVEA